MSRRSGVEHGTDRRWCLRAWAAAAWVATFAWAAAGGGNDLRLYTVRSEVFGYLLTAASIGADRVPVLSFKDLAGTTRFVRVGDKLGDWIVADYQPRTGTVFKPSVNAQLNVDTSIAILRNAEGQERILPMGVPLEQAGRMACFVSLASGAWAYARRGDALTLDGLALSVVSVDESVAQVRADGQAFDVPLVSGAERQTVMDVWRSRQEQADAQARALADEQQRQKAERIAAENAHAAAATTAATAHAPQQAARFSFGYEYRYPTEYEVLQYTTRTPNGSLRAQTIVVPTQFGTRSVGISHEVH